MAELRANFATTTLTANIVTTPAAGTSEAWAVASTALPFPQTGTYRATIGSLSDATPEIVLITAVNDATHFQVQRGAESSTIKTHTSGDAFSHTLTAGALAVAVWTDKVNTWVAGSSSDMSAVTSLILPSAAGAAPTVGGDVRYDSTQAALKGGGSGAISGAILRVLSVQRSTSDSLTNSTAAEQNFATTFTLPANYLIAGKVIRVHAHFQETTGGSPATQVFRVKLGSTVVVSHGALAVTASQTTKSMTWLWLIVGTAAPGAAAAVESTPVAITGNLTVVANQTVQPVNVATNASQAITLSIQYGGTGSTDTVTLRQLVIEELN